MTIPLEERFIEEILEKAGFSFDRFIPSAKLRIALNKVVLEAYTAGSEDAAMHELERQLYNVANKTAVKEEPIEDRITLDTDTQIFFYEQDHYYLSNFSSFNLIWNGVHFPTVEHAYQWCKFNHPISATYQIERAQVSGLIVEAASAHDAYRIASVNKHLIRQDWESVKFLTMKNLLVAKVQQHAYVRKKLISTGARELIENSWRDNYWGWGPKRDGFNMLGKCWMQVRNELNAGFDVWPV